MRREHPRHVASLDEQATSACNLGSGRAKRVIDSLKPLGRAVKYDFLYRKANILASVRRKREIIAPPPVFIIGCGRSGTTALGEMVAGHKQVRYLFEPYYLWAAIDARTDVSQLFLRGEARCLMDASHCTTRVSQRYNSLIGHLCSRDGLLVEKTPINTMRIGYLVALAPEAKFIHIIRDGIEVARSIRQAAETTGYRIAGKPGMNRWWGIDQAKWKFLVHDGRAAGYYPDEVAMLKDNYQKGAYEWLISIREVDRHRSGLGDRLFELTYDELIASPASILSRLCDFLGLGVRGNWVRQALGVVRPRTHQKSISLGLPSAMRADFNTLQDRLGFTGRAVEDDGQMPT